jgi:hypothetical protein
LPYTFNAAIVIALIEVAVVSVAFVVLVMPLILVNL